MKRLLIKILFRLLNLPSGDIDTSRIAKWVGSQYPEKGFRDYIAKRGHNILQSMGEGLSRDDYLMHIGMRMEIGKLLTEAKTNFEIMENQIKKRKQNENNQNKKS